MIYLMQKSLFNEHFVVLELSYWAMFPWVDCWYWVTIATVVLTVTFGIPG